MDNQTNAYIGTPFEPFGGMTPCVLGETDCTEEALYATEGVYVYAICQNFVNSSKLDFDGGMYCACGVEYGAYGKDCLQFSSRAVMHWWLLVPIMVTALALFMWQLYIFREGFRLRVIKINPATVTLISSSVTTITICAWTLLRALNFTKISSLKITTLNRYGAGLTGMTLGVSMTLVILIWNQVISSSKTMRKTSGGMSKKAKSMVIAGCVGITTSMCVAFFVLNDTGLAAIFAMLYFLVLAVVYTYRGVQLKTLVSKMAGGAGSDNKKKVAKIQQCILSAKVFITSFTITCVLYGILNNTKEKDDTDVDHASVLLPDLLHIETLYMSYAITIYCVGPLKDKISSRRSTVTASVLPEKASTINPTQPQSKSPNALPRGSTANTSLIFKPETGKS